MDERTYRNIHGKPGQTGSPELASGYDKKAQRPLLFTQGR
jgi:hypothetical protein